MATTISPAPSDLFGVRCPIHHVRVVECPDLPSRDGSDLAETVHGLIFEGYPVRIVDREPGECGACPEDPDGWAPSMGELLIEHRPRGSEISYSEWSDLFHVADILSWHSARDAQVTIGVPASAVAPIMAGVA